MWDNFFLIIVFITKIKENKLKFVNVSNIVKKCIGRAPVNRDVINSLIDEFQSHGKIRMLVKVGILRRNRILKLKLKKKLKILWKG